MMQRITILFLVGLCATHLSAQPRTPAQRADSVLRLMTLDEKVGQLHQLSSDFATGPIKPSGDLQQQVRDGKIGSLLNLRGAARTRQLQEMAMQSRRRIPLLFGQDVIHGYRTTFPIPLAEAASWDLREMENTARIAAAEASAAGIHWTFAPMVDIGRDPRWGRVMEGAGEDAYLGSRIAAARVKGFQGRGFGDTASVLACAKHFAAYGAAVGGRDYNSVDMSERQLWEVYLPPFKAALDAGVATFMNSFNDLNGIPATASTFLQQEILKGKWNFRGFVVSDWGSVAEMIPHGYASDHKDAAMKAMNAGNDMDMESRAYTQHLAQLVKEGKVSITRVNDAVRRILIKKFELGLFDDPFRYSNAQREAAQFNNAQHHAAAQRMAAKSIVLLKNDTLAGTAVLPLKTSQRIALIGPLAKDKKANLGFWSFDFEDDSLRLASLYDGMQGAAGPSNIMYAKGCELTGSDSSGFAEARSIALQADVIVMQLGEGRDWSGEAKSRSDISLSAIQLQLLHAMKEAGKPVVVLLSAGRPMVIGDVAASADALLYTWWLGMKAGHAMADVLYGKYNPAAKLPMSFPRSVGQIPIYYNHYNTGRPSTNDDHRFYVSAYTDLPNSPQYAFGFGLSYSRFNYGALTIAGLADSVIQTNTIQLRIPVTNTSPVAGEEVVQLYIRDVTGSVVRPVKELKGFEKIMLKGGETKTVTFTLSRADLQYYNAQSKLVWEPGEFWLMVGGSSDRVVTKKVWWK